MLLGLVTASLLFVAPGAPPAKRSAPAPVAQAPSADQDDDDEVAKPTAPAAKPENLSPPRENKALAAVGGFFGTVGALCAGTLIANVVSGFCSPAGIIVGVATLLGMGAGGYAAGSLLGKRRVPLAMAMLGGSIPSLVAVILTFPLQIVSYVVAYVALYVGYILAYLGLIFSAFACLFSIYDVRYGAFLAVTVPMLVVGLAVMAAGVGTIILGGLASLLINVLGASVGGGIVAAIMSLAGRSTVEGEGALNWDLFTVPPPPQLPVVTGQQKAPEIDPDEVEDTPPPAPAPAAPLPPASNTTPILPAY